MPYKISSEDRNQFFMISLESTISQDSFVRVIDAFVEARLNLECLWLTSCQYPRYKTISDFRKNNTQAFRSVFRGFVHLLKDIDLLDGKTIAIDSFKIRAQTPVMHH